MKKRAICTISSYNYMAYGLTCLLSAGKYNSDCELFYLVVDEFNEKYSESYNGKINFVNINEIGLSREILEKLAFKYNIIEFNTAVKPMFYSYLFSKGFDSVLYLDPDIECYSSFHQFYEDTKNYSIIVTPHKMTEKKSPYINDRDFLNNGIYNLGFIALNHSAETIRFLNWWHDKLLDECFIDYSNGLATDQIWVELASTIFDNFFVCRNPGMNVAFWNLQERYLCKEDNSYFVNSVPLIFFHFSSLSAKCNPQFVKLLDNDNAGFIDFYEEHIANVRTNNLEFFEKLNYSYANYANGDKIEKEHRWLYGLSYKIQDRFKKPFDADSKSFYYFLNKRKNIRSFSYKNNKERALLLFLKVVGLKKGLKHLGGVSISFVRHLAEMYR